MKLRALLRISFGMLASGAVAVTALMPLRAQSTGASSRNRLIRSSQEKVLESIARRDYASAERQVKVMRARYLNPTVTDPLLVELYTKQGRDEKARVVLRRMIFNPHGIFGDPIQLMYFAKVSEKSGNLNDAKVAYSKVVDIYGYTVGPILNAGVHGANLSLKDGRAIARALYALENHPPGYIAEIRSAVAAAPRQPIPHFVYARLLNAYDRRFSANLELDKAAALLPAKVGATWKGDQYRSFAFDRWDHETAGVTGPGGKMTFKATKIPLTDSHRPMVDAPVTRSALARS